MRFVFALVFAATIFSLSIAQAVRDTYPPSQASNVVYYRTAATSFPHIAVSALKNLDGTSNKTVSYHEMPGEIVVKSYTPAKRQNVGLIELGIVTPPKAFKALHKIPARDSVVIVAQAGNARGVLFYNNSPRTYPMSGLYQTVIFEGNTMITVYTRQLPVVDEVAKTVTFTSQDSKSVLLTNSDKEIPSDWAYTFAEPWNHIWTCPFANREILIEKRTHQ